MMTFFVAEYQDYTRGTKHFKGVSFCCLPETWRIAADTRTVPRGKLLTYLNPIHSLSDLPNYLRQKKEYGQKATFGEGSS